MFSRSNKENYIPPVSRIATVCIDKGFLNSLVNGVNGSAATTPYDEEEEWN